MGLGALKKNSFVTASDQSFKAARYIEYIVRRQMSEKDDGD